MGSFLGLLSRPGADDRETPPPDLEEMSRVSGSQNEETNETAAFQGGGLFGQYQPRDYTSHTDTPASPEGVNPDNHDLQSRENLFATCMMTSSTSWRTPPPKLIRRVGARGRKC